MADETIARILKTTDVEGNVVVAAQIDVNLVEFIREHGHRRLQTTLSSMQAYVIRAKLEADLLDGDAVCADHE